MRKACQWGLLVALAAGSAAIAESFDAGGVASGTTEVTPMPLEEGRMVMALTTTYDSMMGNDDSNPLAGMRGECTGSALQDGEALEGSGFCVFKGDGADAALVRWTATGRDSAGAMTGDWELRGGTGRFEDGSGGGTFSSVVDPETGAAENTIAGNIDLP